MRCNISYSYYYHLLLLLLLSLSYYAYAYTTQSRNHLHINAAVDKLIFLFTHEPIFQSRVYFACTDSISGTDIPPKRPPKKKTSNCGVFFSPLAAASWCSDLNNFSQFSTDCANCCQVALQFKNQKLVFSFVEHLKMLRISGQNADSLLVWWKHVKTNIFISCKNSPDSLYRIRFDSLVTKSKNMSLETVAVWCHSSWNNESSQTRGQNKPMTLDPPSIRHRELQ